MNMKRVVTMMITTMTLMMTLMMMMMMMMTMTHFRYSRAECGDWLDSTLARLATFPARVRTVLEQQYSVCKVNYRDNLDQQGELFDFSMFERVGSPN